LQMEKIYASKRQIEVRDFILKKNFKHVLEVGCALNSLDNFFTDKWFDKKTLTVVEPDETFADTFREKPRKFDSVKLFQMTLLEFISNPERLKAYDFIVINCLLHEVDNPIDFIQQCKQILVRGGMLWINVPNSDSLHRVIAESTVFNNNDFQVELFNRATSYSIDKLLALIERSGGRTIWSQSRILKVMTDLHLQSLINSENLSPELLDLWLNFKSTELYIGAELDVICSFPT